MYKPESILLRRTTAALAAATGLLAFADAQAQSAVKLTSGTNTAECTYATMSVAPNGTVNVSCSGTISSNTGGTTTPPPPSTAPTSFSLSSSGGTVLAGATTGLTIVRNGLTTGTFIVTYNADGDACSAWGDYAVTFADGNNTPKPVPAAALRSIGSRCTITLGPAIRQDGSSANLNASPTAATFTVGASAPPPPPGCPATPQGMVSETWQLNGLHNYWQAPQNVVVSVPMPTSGTGSSPNFMWTPSPRTNSPAQGYVRYSVTKCPGQIIEDDPVNFCNGRNAITYWSQKYVAIPGGAYPNRETANMFGVCWAPQSEGPWYLNIRYENFVSEGGTACPGGIANCGVLWQHQ